MKPFGPPRRAARNRWPAATMAVVMLAGASLAACQTTDPGPGPVAVVAPAAPTDYRLRHPIALREGTRAVELFIGSHRTDLTPVQRAEVASFGQDWHRHATGGVAIRVPTNRRPGEPSPKSGRFWSPPASPLMASSRSCRRSPRTSWFRSFSNIPRSSRAPGRAVAGPTTSGRAPASTT
jgi:hypothetical protein